MSKRNKGMLAILFIVMLFISRWLYAEVVSDRLMSYVPINYMNLIGSLWFALTFIILLSLYTTVFIQQIYMKKYSKIFLYMSLCGYILVMIYLLFFKSIGVQGFSLQPLGFITDIMEGQALEVFANIIFFIPLGGVFAFYKVGLKKVVIISIVMLFAIETVQYVFRLGFFDIADIEINLLGIVIGYTFLRKRLGKIK